MRLAVEPAVAGEDHQGHDQQDGRDRRGLLPARDLVDQRVEQVGDHRHAPAAQHRRRDVEAQAQDEDQQRAGRQRRQGQREVDLPEDRARRRAQRGRCLQQPVVDADHRGEQRQHQERQQHVGHADGDAELVVEELHRRIGEAEPLQAAVHQAAIAQHDDPGIGAHQDADPERQHHQGDGDQSCALAEAAHPMRQRVADGDVGDRGDQRDAQRVAQHPQIDGRLEQSFIVLEREAPPLVPEGEAQHVDDGQVEGDDHQHQERCDEGEALPTHRSVPYRLSLKASHFLFTASPFSAHHSAFSKYWMALFCLLVGYCQSLSLGSSASRSGLGPV